MCKVKITVIFKRFVTLNIKMTWNKSTKKIFFGSVLLVIGVTLTLAFTGNKADLLFYLIPLILVVVGLGFIISEFD